MQPAAIDYVQEWLKVHRSLLDLEAAFTDLAIKAAAGEVDLDELAEARTRLMGTRELCTAAYERAFPKLRSRQSSK